MRQMFVFAAAVTVSTAAVDLAHAGACAPMGWMAQIMTPSSHAIAANGAIVVVAVPGGDSDSDAGKNPAVAPWKLSNDKTSVALEVTEVGPGVAVYKPAKPSKGLWKVVHEDGKETGSGVELSGQSAQPLSAPALSAAEFRRRTIESDPSDRGNRTVESCAVTLGRAAPEEALGLVVYRKFRGELQPALFTRIGSASGKEITMWSTPGRCAPRMPGQIQPGDGDEVVAAWLDRNGLISEHSPAVKVSFETGGGDSKSAQKTPASKPETTSKDSGGCTASGHAPGAGSVFLLLLALARRRLSQATTP